jgi:hypothetical protein
MEQFFYTKKAAFLGTAFTSNSGILNFLKVLTPSLHYFHQLF